MIKWAGYGKSLKLLFFGLLISCFTLLENSFVNADNIDGSHYQLVGLSSSISFVDSQYEITFLKGGGLLTSFLGYGRGLFALSDKVLFWWTPDGLPYVYADQLNGYFDKASSCDSILSGGNYVTPSNCSEFDINLGTGPTIFKNFFENVNQGDVVYYKYRFYPGNNATTNFSLCFNSEELNKSICFDSCVIRGTSLCSSNLSGSIDFGTINVGFTTIPQSYIGPAPGQNGYMNNYEGSQGGLNEGYVDSFLTGSVFSQECTVGNAKSYAESIGMTKNLCFGGLPLDSTGVVIPVPGSGASVFDIFSASSNGMNFTEWFNYRLNIYNNRYVYNTGVWVNTPAPLYPYFNFYSQYGQQFTVSEIQDYCRIIVNNMNLDSSWHGNSAWCPTSFYGGGGGGGGGSSWGDDTGTGGTSSNNQAQGVSWVGVGNITGDTYKSPKTYIQDFFNKAREVISTDFVDANSGFLPTYIITFLLAIILFRFLRH